MYRILNEQLHYVSKHLRWVPHSLNSSQKVQRVTASNELLKPLRISKEDDYNFFYTGDESWFYLNNYYERKWVPHQDIPSIRI